LHVEEVTFPKPGLGRFTLVIWEFDLCRAEKDTSCFWRIQDGKKMLLVVM